MYAIRSYYENLTTRDGLSHNTVNCLLEDSKGYIWFGTEDGLCKYNGYSTMVYKNTAGKKLFPDNHINALIEDQNKNIWIASELGISLFHTTTERFQQVYTHVLDVNNHEKPLFQKIFIDSLNNQVVCTSKNAGIFLYNSYNFV